MALQCLEAAGFRPKGDVIFASVVDEESAGANGLSPRSCGRTWPMLACTPTEWSSKAIWPTRRGQFRYRAPAPSRFAGTTIDRAMEILPAFYAELRRYAAERREKIDADPRYAGGRWPGYAVRMMAFQAGSFDGGNAGGGRIRGSTAYVLPGESIPEILAGALKIVSPRSRTVRERVLPPRITTFGRIMPPSAVDQSDPFVGVVARSYRSARPDCRRNERACR